MINRPDQLGGRLRSVDTLRGLAVLAVVLHHLPFSWRGISEGNALVAFGSGITRVLHYGEYGVHLFLVISGFCIHLGWARAADTSRAPAFSGFWLRRLRRLYPPYVAALVMTVTLLFLGQVVLTGRLNSAMAALGYASGTDFALDLGASLLLLQNLTGAPWRLGNGPFWTLALEEQLYALYFPLLFLRRRFGWVTAFGTALGVTVAWRAFGVLLWADEARPGFWFLVGPARWAEWALGAIAVEAHLGLIKLPPWMSRLRSAALFALLSIGLDELSRAVPGARPWTMLPGDFAFALAFFFAINWVCRLEATGGLPRWKWLEWLGAVGVYSYSVYLVHQPLMAAVKRVVVASGSLWLVIGVRLLAAVVGGYVFHLLVEKRFLNRPAREPPRPEAPAPMLR